MKRTSTSIRTRISINLTKANTKSYLNLGYNGRASCLYVNKTENCKFKPHDEIP